MPQIRPFKGIRPDSSKVQQSILPSSIVFDETQHLFKNEDNPYSYTRLLSALAPVEGLEMEKLLQQSKQQFEDFLGANVFVQDSEPCLYLYQIDHQSTTQQGIICTVDVMDYANNTIKKHENTRKNREIQLQKFLSTIGINTTPVILTYKSQHNIDTLVYNISQKQATFDVKNHENNRFQLWKIEDTSTIENLQEAFEQINHFYIADGHHRAKIALNCFDELADKTDAANTDFKDFMVVLFPDNQLKIHPFYRLIKKDETFDLNKILDHLKQNYLLKPCSLEQMYYQYLEKNCFLICLNDKTYLLKPKQKPVFDTVIDRLDVSILQNTILEPVFGIANPSTDQRIAFGSHNIALADFKALLNQKDTLMIFLSRAPSVEDVFAIADNKQTMPPKSTSFEPKMLSGLVMHQVKNTRP